VIKVKKGGIVGFWFIVVILVLVAPHIVAATPRLSIEDVQVAPGGSKKVPIYIYDVTDPAGVGTVQLDLLYDSSIVEISGTDNSTTDFDFVASNYANTNGTFTVGGSYIGAPPGLTGTVRVIDVIFTGVGSEGDATLLDITNTLLMDGTPQQNDIPHDVNDGKLTLGGELPDGTAWTPPPSPTESVPPPGTVQPTGSVPPPGTVQPTGRGAPAPTEIPVPIESPTPTPEPPGFGVVFAIAGLLAVAYVVLRRKQE
jgi:PGF-CTERM protein